MLYNPTHHGHNEHPRWASDTMGRCNNPTLIMQDDGNLVLYAVGGHPIWATGTYGGKRVNC